MGEKPGFQPKLDFGNRGNENVLAGTNITSLAKYVPPEKTFELSLTAEDKVFLEDFRIRRPELGSI